MLRSVKKAKIVVSLPRNRSSLGKLALIDDSGELIYGPVRAYGKADNAMAARKGNPTRDPKRPFGDTPSGGYAVRFSPAPMADRSTYGQYRVGFLDPLSGDALTAEENGRTGLWLHGGTVRDGQLRPTYGCIRVDDGTMLELYELSKQYNIDRLEVIDAE